MAHDDNDSDFEVYSVYICYASVCTRLSVEEATAKLNGLHPTGISSEWRFADDETEFADGTPNPHPCKHRPDTHMHYLFVC